MSTRLFVAVHPSDEAAHHLAGVARRLVSVPGRPDDARPWHVTLVFLGVVPDPLLPAVHEVVDAAAREAAPGELTIAGGGHFHRTVLWAGLDGDVATLSALAADLRTRLPAVGVPHDAKPFRPHLTVGRPRRRVDEAALRADLATLSAYRGPSWAVRTVELLASRTVDGRPRYEPLRRWSLGGTTARQDVSDG